MYKESCEVVIDETVLVYMLQAGVWLEWPGQAGFALCIDFALLWLVSVAAAFQCSYRKI